MGLSSLLNRGLTAAGDFDLAGTLGLRDKNGIGANIQNQPASVITPKTSKSSYAIRDIERFRDANTITDPLYLRFKIFFDFSAETGFLSTSGGVNTALSYLKRIGDAARYALLEDFIDSLKRFSCELPFMMQDLDGLADILPQNPQTFLPEDTKITIHCLESIDMKVQKLVTSYRKIVYDDVRRVEVIPTNLRRFGMHIFLYSMQTYRILQSEFEEIANSKIGATDSIPQQYNSVQQEVLLRSLPVAYINDDELVVAAPNLFNNTVFRFDECEFDIANNGLDFLSSISNVPGEPVRNSLSIKLRYFEIDSEITNIFAMGNGSIEASFSFLMAAINEKATNNMFAGTVNYSGTGSAASALKTPGKKSIWDEVKDQFKETFSVDNLKKMGASAVDMVQSSAVNLAGTYLKKLVFGNIYDNGSVQDMLGAFDSLSSGNINNVVTAAQKFGIGMPTIGGNASYSPQVTLGDNIYPNVPNVPEKQNTKASLNMYPEQQAKPEAELGSIPMSNSNGASPKVGSSNIYKNRYSGL